MIEPLNLYIVKKKYNQIVLINFIQNHNEFVKII